MNPLVARLDEWLRTHRPDYYQKLQPGATDEELAKFEQQVGFAVPESFKDLYRWRNGQAGNCYKSLCNNSCFVPLEDVADSSQVLGELLEGGEFEDENWWAVGWLPFLHNGGGDHVCLDLAGTFTGQPGQILEFWHADSDRNVLAPDFGSFLTALVLTLEQNEFDEDEEIWEIDWKVVSERYPGFPKSFEAGT